MDDRKRHRIFWHMMKPIVGPVVFFRFNYKSKRYRPEGPYIVVCNHVTDWDPLLLGLSFRNQMYFVASEHIMRQGFASKLLKRYLDPITRQKGGSAAGSVKAILRTVKDGGNVCIFPEGNRTWDGVTRDFPASTGKLIRSSGCSLVTFRLSGGYFASPRWSGNSARRGRIDGELVGIYSPEELKAMKPAEINELIARDIHEDAYATQSGKHIPFRGKKLAEHLETYLFTCPKCGAMHRMKSEDDRFFCRACGAETRYSVDGSFLGGAFPFHGVKDWAAWQTEQIAAMCETAEPDKPLFRDSGFDLYVVQSAKGSQYIGKGEIALYRDRIELPGEIDIPITDIEGMSLRGAVNMYISTKNGNTFELKTDGVRCTEKYLEACSFLGADIGCGV